MSVHVTLPVPPVLIRGGYVLTLDDVGTIIPEGDLLIEGDQIAAVGRAISPPRGCRIIEARGRLVMPGLINAHMHSDEALFRGLLDNMPLEVWMLYSLPPLGYGPVPQRLIYLRTQLAAIELLRTGTTTIQDDVSEAPLATVEGTEAVLQGYLDAGLRANVACNLTNKAYDEKLPYMETLLPEWAAAEIRAHSPQRAADLLEVVESLLQRWQGREGRIQVAISASAPQRCTDGFLTALDDLSRRWRTPLLTHVLETKTQVVTAREFYGRSMMEHLDALGMLSNRLTIAHAIWMTERDVALAAATGTAVAHNPVSNLKLGSGIMRLRALLDAGVPVALGTDGSSSNDAFNMFEVMKCTASLHKITSPVVAEWPSAAEVLRMTLRGGARSTLLQGEIGVLAPGFKADVVALRRDAPAFVPFHRPENHLVYCENGQDVETVLVGGRVVVDDGKVVTVDPAAVYAEIATLMPDFMAMIERAYGRSRALEPLLWELYGRCQREDAGMNRFALPPEAWTWPHVGGKKP